MKNGNSFYASLKQSPLAKGREESTAEEVAIWLDMNNLTTRKSIEKMLKEIEKNFHSSNTDLLVDDSMQMFYKILKNSLYGSSSTPYGRFNFPMLQMQYLSDNALYWLFKVMSSTSALDNVVLDNKFLEFAEKTKDKHRQKSMAHKSLGPISLPIPSKTDQCLYEVFAELVDIIKAKITKMPQSPLS